MNSYLRCGASYLTNREEGLIQQEEFSWWNNNILSANIFVDLTARYCLIKWFLAWFLKSECHGKTKALLAQTKWFVKYRKVLSQEKMRNLSVIPPVHLHLHQCPKGAEKEIVQTLHLGIRVMTKGFLFSLG